MSFCVDSLCPLKDNTQLRSRGGVPEWLKGSDCKSDGSAFGGSNPPPSTIFLDKWSMDSIYIAGADIFV